MSYFEHSRKWNRTKQRMLIKELQLNVEEFTLMMAQKIDFSTFDVLSISRTDVQPSIKQQLKHPKIGAQMVQPIRKTAKVIPLFRNPLFRK